MTAITDRAYRAAHGGSAKTAARILDDLGVTHD